MRTIWYVAILVVFFLAQFVLSWKAKKVSVKCIPAIVILLLMLAAFINYALSGWTNWAWLIIMLLEAGILTPVALAAVLGTILGKAKNKSSV